MILRKWTWAILIAMSCLFVACDDDETIIAPSEIVSGIDNNQIDLKAGESTEFAPSFDANGNLVYQWLLNGEKVSEEKTYTFSSDIYGKYTLRFEVSNETGKQSVEYAIRVCGISDITSDVEDNAVKMNMGESKLLKPIFEAEGDLIYTWTLDDKKVSEEKEYTFEGKNPGKYSLKFEIAQGEETKSLEYAIKVDGTYSNGVFIVNEGWFGHEPGSVNFWDRESDEIQFKVYEKENSGKELGITTQFACIDGGKLFLVSKDPDHLVVVNSETLIEEGRVSLTTPGVQARGFAYQDAAIGYLSSSDGIFKVDLAQFKMGEKIPAISGEVGKMMVLEGKLFALNSSKLFVINTSTLAIEKTIEWEGYASGMVTDKDGQLWISVGAQLVKVDPASLEVETIELPEGVAVHKGFVWDAGSLTYSKQENALLFSMSGGWAPGSVAKFDIATKTAEEFCTIDSDFQIYGAGTYVDPVTNKLYVTAVKNGWGQNYKYNKLYVYAMDGSLEKVMDYEHFYFAALCVVNE